MSEIKKTTNWDQYEAGREDAEDADNSMSSEIEKALDVDDRIRFVKWSKLYNESLFARIDIVAHLMHLYVEWDYNMWNAIEALAQEHNDIPFWVLRKLILEAKRVNYFGEMRYLIWRTIPMSNIDRTTNWEQYEAGREDAEDILEHSSNILFGIRRAVNEYAVDELLSKPGQLSYKFGYLDVIIKALEDESERVKNDILTYYIEGDNENGRESEGNTDSDERSVDPGSEAGDI